MRGRERKALEIEIAQQADQLGRRVVNGRAQHRRRSRGQGQLRAHQMLHDRILLRYEYVNRFSKSYETHCLKSEFKIK